MRFGAEYEQSLVVGTATRETSPGSGQFYTEDVWQSPVYHLGGEFVYAGMFAVRAGYLNDADGDVKDWTAGFGVNWADAAFEFARSPQAESLSHVSRFALWYKY